MRRGLDACSTTVRTHGRANRGFVECRLPQCPRAPQSRVSRRTTWRSSLSAVHGRRVSRRTRAPNAPGGVAHFHWNRKVYARQRYDPPPVLSDSDQDVLINPDKIPRVFDWSADGSDEWLRFVEVVNKHNEAVASVGSSVGGDRVSKVQLLRIEESDLQERFVKGGGHGGQKVNKAVNCVFLRHLPTGTSVKCHKFREQHRNRKEARRLMLEKLRDMMPGVESGREKLISKVKRRKSRSRRRYQRDELEQNADTDSAISIAEIKKPLSVHQSEPHQTSVPPDTHHSGGTV